WGWGLVNTAIAVSDVFLVKSIATAVVKVGVEGLVRVSGSAAWGATREWMVSRGWEEGVGSKPLHHWLIPQNGWGKYVPEVVKNQPYNIMGTGSRAFHLAIEGKSYLGVPGMNMAGRLWFGSPTWAKTLLVNAVLRGVNHYEPEW